MKRKAGWLLGFGLLIPVGLLHPQFKYPFQNPDLPLETRVGDLVSRLTLEEKVFQMMHNAPPIERLGIPEYNWWSEALHGVARSGEKVTVFPQAIGLAATFSPEDIEIMGDIIATEGRAIFNQDRQSGKNAGRYRGLTYWTPNINIFRDPRWGRGQETYGEDPYLTGQLGAAFVRGLQGTDPVYLKASACAKHFAVHSGPEAIRHQFDVRVSLHDLWDTYLPAFRDLVVDARVSGVMCAYNRFFGQPCCGNDRLLIEILRLHWNFSGYLTSDCWAINDFIDFHKTHADPLVAASDALIHGTDLECGGIYKGDWNQYKPGLYIVLIEAVRSGRISEKQINRSLKRLFTVRFRLGLFDPIERQRYAAIPVDVLESSAHQSHALKMARQSIVLLKNRNSLLPLAPAKIKRLAIIGPNADDQATPLGNYNGIPSRVITPLQGISAEASTRNLEIIYAKGCGHVAADPAEPVSRYIDRIRKADVIVFVGGISPTLEGEEGDTGTEAIEGFSKGDRTTIALPRIQTQVMKELKTTGRPLVFINMSGSAMAMEWEAKNADAIIQAWYGGQAIGEALADILFGNVNPSGKLPVTFYRSDADLPPFDEYSMANRTYRYFKGIPRFPFGFGLSYTTFRYSRLEMPSERETGADLNVRVRITNTGNREGEEVIQLYVSHLTEVSTAPLRSLQGFRRIGLKAGEYRAVEFLLSPKDLARVDEFGNRVQYPGPVSISIGGGKPGHAQTMSAIVYLTGDRFFVD